MYALEPAKVLTNSFLKPKNNNKKNIKKRRLKNRDKPFYNCGNIEIADFQHITLNKNILEINKISEKQ